MEMIVLGIDHDLQLQDLRLKGLISELVEHEGAQLIAEENRCFSNTLGRQIAGSMNLPWLQIDMSTQERIKSGIYEKLANRMQIRGYDARGEPILAIRYAPIEDGIREEFWLDKIGGLPREKRHWSYADACTVYRSRRKPKDAGTE
jgi:hypothetical protein